MKTHNNTTYISGRRTFLKNASKMAFAAAVFPTIIPAKALGRDGHTAPSNRVSLAVIGLGQHGFNRNLKCVSRFKDANITTLCDVDKRKLNRAMKFLNDSKIDFDKKNATQDFRDTLSRDDVDAVIIAIPDHWHVPMCVMALNAGKDVFCEKPPYSLDEGRILTETVQRTGKIFQTGLEDRALPVYMRMYDIVKNGGIGKVEKILIELPYGSPLPNQTEIKNDIKVPAELDYEMYVGPADFIPYQTEAQWWWRWVKNFGLGTLLDWGTHQCDVAQWILGEDENNSLQYVDCKNVIPFLGKGFYDNPIGFELDFVYGTGITMNVIMNQSGQRLRIEGSKGWIESPRFNAPLIANSADVLNFRTPPESTRARTEKMWEHRDFIDCVFSRRRPYMDEIMQDGICTPLHVGDIAVRLGRKVIWDNKTFSFVNDEAANKLKFRKPLRGEWSKSYNYA